mgnify:CR=1 FL=1
MAAKIKVAALRMNRQLPSYSQPETRSSNDSFTQSAEYVLLERVLRRLLEDKPATEDETNLYLNYARHLAAAIVASQPALQLDDPAGSSADSGEGHGAADQESGYGDDAANDLYLDEQDPSPAHGASEDFGAVEEPRPTVVDELFEALQSSCESVGPVEAEGVEPSASSPEQLDSDAQAPSDDQVGDQSVVEAFFDSMGVNMAPGLMEFASPESQAGDETSDKAGDGEEPTESLDQTEAEAILEANAAKEEEMRAAAEIFADIKTLREQHQSASAQAANAERLRDEAEADVQIARGCFRHLAKVGQQKGRRGTATFFYPKVCLE